MEILETWTQNTIKPQASSFMLLPNAFKNAYKHICKQSIYKHMSLKLPVLSF